MKNLIISLITLTTILVLPSHVVAQVATEQECTQVYGGGVVCGAETHVPVDAAIGDNPLALVAGLFGGSVTLFLISKKLKIATSKAIK